MLTSVPNCPTSSPMSGCVNTLMAACVCSDRCSPRYTEAKSLCPSRRIKRYVPSCCPTRSAMCILSFLTYLHHGQVSRAVPLCILLSNTWSLQRPFTHQRTLRRPHIGQE